MYISLSLHIYIYIERERERDRCIDTAIHTYYVFCLLDCATCSSSDRSKSQARPGPAQFRPAVRCSLLADLAQVQVMHLPW